MSQHAAPASTVKERFWRRALQCHQESGLSSRVRSQGLPSSVSASAIRIRTAWCRRHGSEADPGEAWAEGIVL
jgi:hypothetical protein